MTWQARILAAALAGLAFTGVARAQPFDPRAHRDFAGPPSEVLVLGTPHLSGLPAAFELESLGPLLDRLAAWQPAIITIEALSGIECDLIARSKARYGSAYADYCWDPEPARKATGLDVTAAAAEAERMLADWPGSPTAAQRRRLAALFIAAGDRASALVQWLRLPPAERREGDGIDAALVEVLTKVQARRNENYAIAAVLAARLGLERVYPVDDHTADAIFAGVDEKAFAAALGGVRDAAAPRLAELRAEEVKLGTPEATLAYYRFHNSPAAADAAFAYDFGAALKEPSAQRFGRRYVGWWEARNLRMVANIRAAIAGQPGARVLAIVGSSHKGYFEAYLAMMHEVKLADAEAVLR